MFTKEFGEEETRNSSETKSIHKDCKRDNVLLDDKNEVVDEEVLQGVCKILKYLLTGLPLYLEKP